MRDTISCEGIEVRYGDVIALNDVTMTIRRGTPLVLMGRNGAGKTTLLSTLAGLLAPVRGSLRLPRGATVSYLPEDRGVYPSMTVMEHLRFFADVSRAPREAVERWIGAFQIEDYAHIRVGDLSKGNQQRVQLACALIDSPDCVLLDEPFSGLDPIGRGIVGSVIHDYATTHWVVLSAHEVDSVSDLVADLAFISGGRIVEAGPIDCLYADYGGNSLLIANPQSVSEALTRRPDLEATAAGAVDGSGNGHWLRIKGLAGYADAIDLLAHATTDPGQFHWAPPALSDLFVTILGEEGSDHV